MSNKTKKSEDFKEKEKRKKYFYEYRRVSTRSQKNKETIKRQELLNNKFLEFNNDKYEVKRVFIDDGRSGFKSGKKDRPAYWNMIKHLEKDNDIDGVLVLKVNRLGRDTQELINFKEKIKELGKEVLISESGLLLKFDNPMENLIYDIQAGISNYVGKSIIKKMQFMRKVEYDKHPEKFGRPKKEIPKKLRNKIIKMYRNQKQGFHNISKFLFSEDIDDYPDWFQRKNPKGFGKGDDQFYLSPPTIGKRLKEWGVEIRSPKYRRNREN